MKTKPVHGASLVMTMLARNMSLDDVCEVANLKHRASMSRRLNSNAEEFDLGFDDDRAAAFCEIPTLATAVRGARELSFDKSPLGADSAVWALGLVLKDRDLGFSDRWAANAALIPAALAQAFTYDKVSQAVVLENHDALLTARASLRVLREMHTAAVSTTFTVRRELIGLLIDNNLAACVFLEECAEGVAAADAERRYQAIILAAHDIYPSVRQAAAMTAGDPSMESVADAPLVVARVVAATAIAGMAEAMAVAGHGDQIVRMIKANAGAIFPSAREKRLLLQLAYRAAWGHTAPTFAGLLGIEVEEKSGLPADFTTHGPDAERPGAH